MESNQNIKLTSSQESKNSTKIINLISCVTFLVIYIAVTIYGIVCILNPNYDTSQAKLIVTSGICGILLSFLFPGLDFLFGIKINVVIKSSIFLFAFCALVLGEAFCLYYKIPWWDTFLHYISGLLFALIGSYLLAAIYKKDNISHKRITLIVGGILISFSIGLMWEIYEFTFDSLFGTNMQKVIPEVDGLFNGGDSSLILNGSNDLIADFFKTPAGYRYALMDTMEDIVCCFTGGLTYLVISLVLTRKKESPFVQGIIFTNNNIIIRVKNFKQKSND